ncbi:MAG TPA: hypothetical protein VHM90_05455, partial [Phycisphaerae bacterium]|nr:hypothetical protein [Phycisphaerae bacterium]
TPRHALLLVRPNIVIHRNIEADLFGPGYDRPTGLPGTQTAPASVPATSGNTIHVFDIRDFLVQRDPNDEKFSRESAIEKITTKIKDAVAPASWKDEASIRELNGQLIIRQTEENQKQILALLQKLRMEASLQVAVETRVLYVTRNFKDDFRIGYDIDVPFKDAAGKSVNRQASIIDDWTLNLLLKMTQDDHKSISADGQRVTLFDGVRGYFGTPSTEVDLPNSDPAAKKKVTLPALTLGLVGKVSADHKSVALTLEDTFNAGKKPDEKAVRTTLSIPDGGILLINVGDIKLPGDDDTRQMILLIRPTPIVHEEQPANAATTRAGVNQVKVTTAPGTATSGDAEYILYLDRPAWLDRYPIPSDAPPASQSASVAGASLEEKVPSDITVNPAPTTSVNTIVSIPVGGALLIGDKSRPDANTRTIVVQDAAAVSKIPGVTATPSADGKYLLVKVDRATADADEAARKRLAENLKEITCDQQSLEKVLAFLRDNMGANISVDWPTLEKAGIKRTSPVTLSVKEVSFAKALNLALQSAAGEKAGFVVQDGVIVISTREALKDKLFAPPADAAADKKVDAALAENLKELTADSQGLDKVVSFLRDTMNINVFVDWESLRAVGIERNTPVTVSVKEVSVGAALRAVLESAGAGKTQTSVEGGVLMITAKLPATAPGSRPAANGGNSYSTTATTAPAPIPASMPATTPSADAAQKNPKVAALIAEARKLYDQTKFLEAEALVQQATAIDPQDEQARLLLRIMHDKILTMGPDQTQPAGAATRKTEMIRQDVDLNSLLIPYADLVINPDPSKPRPESPNVITARKLAETVIDLSADKERLESVVIRLRDAVRLNIFVNWDQLKAAGLGKDTPVTLDLKSVPARDALLKLLATAGTEKGKLAYTIDEGIITVSSQEDLQSAKYQMVRVFDVRDLLTPLSPTAPDAAAAKRDAEAAWLMELITSTVAPESWRDAGGKIGSIRMLNGQLIVNQTVENQTAVGTLLADLRAATGTQVLVKTLMIRADAAPEGTQLLLALPEKDGKKLVLIVTPRLVEKPETAPETKPQHP